MVDINHRLTCHRHAHFLSQDNFSYPVPNLICININKFNMHVAFVTYAGLPDLNHDDKIIARYLSEKNIHVTPVLWDDATVDWRTFNVIVLRSMWDYFERPGEFNVWIEKMESLGCLVLNPLSVVRWNSNKRYFDSFLNRGFKLPSYGIYGSDCADSLTEILKSNSWTKAVVKPAISGGAYNTWVTTLETADSDESRFRKLLATGEIIVQKFVDDILTEGELSLIFFNKQFSHAIQKKPKAGDFRVQTQFGGSSVSIDPSKDVMEVATALIESIEEPLLYGRVDGVLTSDGNFLLMELELIEPVLSVFTDHNACEKFYRALMDLAIDTEKAKVSLGRTAL
jgi:glutathione synthase/RimK-type ligase-like ATP-grasp enzyme